MSTIPQHLRTAVAAAGLVALGFWLAPRQPAAAPTAGAPTTAPIRDRAPAELDVGAVRAELRAAVRAELARLPAAVEPGAQHDEVVAAVAAPSDHQLAAADQGRGLVDQLLARGRLTGDDARALRPLLAVMDPDDALAVRLSIAQAINADQLAVDGPDAIP